MPISKKVLTRNQTEGNILKERNNPLSKRKVSNTDVTKPKGKFNNSKFF